MIRRIVAHPLGNLADAQGGVLQQLLCPADPLGVEQVVERLPLVPVEQLAEMPLADKAVVGHLLKGQLFCTVPGDIGARLADNEAVGRVLGLRLRPLLPRQAVQHAGHEGERLLNLVHLGGLEQEPGHPQPDRPLGILKVPVAGEHGDLHPGELPLQPRQHGQPVLPRHFDVGEQDIRPVRPDGLSAGYGVPCGSGHTAAVGGPVHHLPQSLGDDGLVVHQQDLIHVLHLPQPVCRIGPGTPGVEPAQRFT